MKKIIFIFIITISNLTYCQSIEQDTLYLYVDKPLLSVDIDGNYSYVLFLPSSDKRFKTDAFKFSIFSQKDFDLKYSLSELIKKIDRKKIPSNKITKATLYMTENENVYKLHEKFSLYKNIYLVFIDPQNLHLYNLLRLDYMGTQKNYVTFFIEGCKF